MEALDEEVNKAEKSLNAANNRQQEDQTHHQKTDRSYRDATSRLSDIQATLEKIATKVAAEESQLLERLNKDLEQAKIEKERFNAEAESLAQAHTRETDELTAQHGSQLEALDSQAQQEEERLEAELAEAKQERDVSIARLEKQLGDALEAGGIDPRELASLENKANELASTCRTVREKETTIRGYEMFMQTDYSRLDGITAEISMFDRQLVEVREQRSKLKQAWTIRANELEESRSRLSETVQRGERDIQRLQNAELVSHSTSGENAPSDSESLALYRVMQASQLVEEFSALLRSQSETRQQLQKLTDRYASVFERYPGTTSSDYWQEVQAHWARTDDREVARANAVVEYFSNNQHALVKESLVHGFHNLDQVDIYRGAMVGFEQRIRKFNRELASHVEETIPFEGIDSIEPHIAFELNELDYWKDIKALADQVRLWREDDDLGLPAESLVAVLRDYLDTFEESHASVGVDDLWRLIRFKFVVVENGTRKVATSPKELPDISSNGLSYLILIVLFQAFVDMHRRGNAIHFHWALDELSNIDKPNKRHLLNMLRDHNISLITACPDLEPRDLGIFDSAYYLERVKDDRKFIRWRIPEMTAPQSNPFAQTLEVTA